MKANHDLNRLIALHVMGWTSEELTFGAPLYSSSIESAWEVVEKLRGPKMAFSLSTLWDHSDGGKFKWIAKWEFWGTKRMEFELADTAPLAICRSALAAVGYEVKDE